MTAGTTMRQHIRWLIQARPFPRREPSLVVSRAVIVRRASTRPSFSQLAASLNAPVGGPGGVRLSTIFNALLVLGVGATALGVYEFYSTFTLWPKEIRADLRAGIKARNQENLALSERYLSRAYQTALSLPPSALGPDPYIKLSGIAAVLSEVASSPRHAREALQVAWERGASSTSNSNDPAWAAYTLTDEERLRRVAVACKLGELSEEWNQDEEEKWLQWAVEEVLKLAGLGAPPAAPKSDETSILHSADDDTSKSIVLAELELPSWMRKVDLGAPLAALGALYARKGQVEYAMPLYLQAISLLLPPKAETVSVEDRCEAAQLMNNLSELIMRRPPSPEIRHQAEAWARQALGVIEHVEEMPSPRKGWFSSRDDQTENREVCNQVLGVVLFNLGMLREMDLDKEAARSLYEKSAAQCQKVGLREGVMQARVALRRIGRSGDTPNVP
ncbi:hypothetical protein F5I97DRAFT_1102244 [Phlebopus sp. FC_14]|nr:hypothetical protein F5I97DRAFT_1102244 [Phlebopus sp. FC_14]